MLIIARGQKEGQPPSQSKVQFNTFFIHKEHIFKAKNTICSFFAIFPYFVKQVCQIKKKLDPSISSILWY